MLYLLFRNEGTLSCSYTSPVIRPLIPVVLEKRFFFFSDYKDLPGPSCINSLSH